MQTTNGSALAVWTGGPAPAVRAFYQGVEEECRRFGIQLYGVRFGFANLMKGKLEECYPIFAQDLALNHRIVPKLSFGREGPGVDPIKCELVIRTILESPNDIRYLILYGGEGSAGTALALDQAAERLHTMFGQRRILVALGPKSIDNDLPISCETIGFSSAATMVGGLIDNVLVDAMNAEPRYYMAVVQGREAGFLAQAAAELARAPLWLIPEQFMTPNGKSMNVKFSFVVDLIVGTILKGAAHISNRSDIPGRRLHGAVVVAEGLPRIMDPETVPGFDQIPRNWKGQIEWGSYPLSDHLASAVAKEIKALDVSSQIGISPFSVKGQTLGYTARGAAADAFDLKLGLELGHSVVYQMVKLDKTGFIPVREVQDGKTRVTSWSLHDLPRNPDGSIIGRQVNPECDQYRVAWGPLEEYRLNERDLSNPQLFERLVATTNLATKAFRRRFLPVAQWGTAQ